MGPDAEGWVALRLPQCPGFGVQASLLSGLASPDLCGGRCVSWSHFRHLGRVAGLAVTHGCPLCLLSAVTPAAKHMEPLKGASWVGGLFKVLPLGSPSLAGETAPRTSLGQRNCVYWGLARAGPGIYLGQFITRQQETDTTGKG